MMLKYVLLLLVPPIIEKHLTGNSESIDPGQRSKNMEAMKSGVCIKKKACLCSLDVQKSCLVGTGRAQQSLCQSVESSPGVFLVVSFGHQPSKHVDVFWWPFGQGRFQFWTLQNRLQQLRSDGLEGKPGCVFGAHPEQRIEVKAPMEA